MNLTAILSSTSASAGAALTKSSNSSSSNTTSGTAAAKAKISASSPLSEIQKRIQANVDSTKTQLSAFGVLKSAVSQSQTAAQALGKLGTTSSDSDTTKAMANFFNGYNAVINASQNASDGAVNSAGRVGKDFQHAIASGATADALKKLGLSIKTDGGLVQDSQKFAQNLKADPAGVRSALAKLGSAIDATAAKELNPTGTLGEALNRLSQRNTTLAVQQKALSSAAQNLAAYKANS